MSVKKLVVNRGYGGFSVSDDVVEWLREQGCEKAHGLTLPGETYSDGSKRDIDGFRDCCYPRDDDLPRDDPHLVEAVEKGLTSDLSIVEVPEGIEWVITEYDGAETVREKHRVFPSGKLARGIAKSYEIEE